MLASLSRRSARVSPATAQQRCLARPITLAPRSRPAVQAVRAQAAFSAPPVSETKKKFLNAFSKPIPAIYSTVIFELLVQQHFVRYNKNYAYNPIFALGFVSVFEQILDSLPEDDRKNIFNAYVRSLSEDPEQYRKDAALLEQTASSLSGPDGLTPDASGSDLQKALASVAESASAGNFAYNKFFAIGLFRLLELTGAKEPAALERLVKSVNVKTEAVNRDLMMYKNILSKLSAAKELMKEFLERERRKNAERLEEKKRKEEAAALAADSNATVQA